ncbi:MAG: LPS assembly lipoprotein LptE [Pseudomonadota bacterium]
MTRVLAPAFMALAVTLVAGCGFEPVYRGDVAGEAGPVAVPTISGRTGHVLRKALLQETRIGLPGTEGQTSIDVDLQERINRLAFRADGAAARSSIRLQARYSLIHDGEPVIGRAESEIYYFVPNAVFGDISAQTNASRQAAEELARRIVEDLRLQLAEPA